ncbi:MAG: nucleotidyltransferase domain-containing protein [Flavobacteriales bacterium]|nr:nucleotidyltransferase domain-containing protein [Flavobacteriales bacterium]
MIGDAHILKVIKQKKLEPLSKTDPRLKPLLNTLKSWAGESLAGNVTSGIKVSGSTAKGTALKGKADLDLLISLKDSTKGTLEGRYDSLFKYLQIHEERLGITKRRRQNVSIRVYTKDYKIDLVPAKKLPGVHNWHYILVRRDSKNRTKTNVDLHIQTVKKSGRQNEILATKIWRDNLKLDFPSIYLELVVIESLRNKGKDQIALNFTRVLEYLSTDFVDKKVVDPANAANTISNLLSKTQKKTIATQARQTLKERFWVNKIW